MIFMLSVNHSYATPFELHQIPSHFLLQLGGYWRTQADNQFIQIDGVVGDYFKVNGGAQSNGLVGVGYFLDAKPQSRFKMSYGVNWFYLPKTQVKGAVFQENLFENLTYAYNVTQYPLYGIAKSTIMTAYPDRYLTLNVGIGPNFMTTSQFQEHSIPDEFFVALPNQLFSGKTTTLFTATAGVGIQVDHFFGKAPLECGYQFFYLGNGKFNVLNPRL